MSLHGLSMSTACQSEFGQRTRCSIESVPPELAAQVRKNDALNEHARCNGCISTRDRLHAFALHETCRRAIVPQDNARVNRADKLRKLVKMESDTMGACDHPTTSQPQRLERFGSTHCYPCSRCSPCSNSTGSTKRNRACLCIGSSMSTARQSQIAERITRSIEAL